VAVIAAGLADTIRIPSTDTNGSFVRSLTPHAGHDRRGRNVAPGSRIGVGTTRTTAAASYRLAV